MQLEIVRSIRGLEAAQIVRPGYDVEYDFVAPGGGCLTHALETTAPRACSPTMPPLSRHGAVLWHGTPASLWLRLARLALGADAARHCARGAAVPRRAR